MEQSAPIGQRPRVLLQSGGGGPRLSPFELITLVVVLVAALYGGYSVYARFTDMNKPLPVAQTFAPAVRATLTSSVTATGTVQSSQQVNLTFDVGQGGGKIKEFMVKLGDQVVAGQALAKLDDADLAQSLKSAESGLASAQARLNAVITPSTADNASAQQAIASAQSQVTNAQKSFDDLKAGPKPADTLTAQQSVLTAQAGVQTAQGNLTKGQNQLMTDQNNVNVASNDVGTAQSTFSSAASQLSAAAGNVSAAITACVPSSPITPPSGATFGGQAQTMLPLAFGLTCGSASTTAKSDLQSQISAYNSSVGSYNTAVAGIQSKQTALGNAQVALTNDQNNMVSLQTSIQTAQASLVTAQQKYQDAVAPPKQSDLDASQSSLEAAKKSLETAQARYDQLLKPKPDAVLPLQAAVDSAAAQMETAKKLLAAATITAPFDGQISQVNGDVGTQIASNTVVFILLNPRTLRIDANVDQAYVSDLRSTQTANVTFDALQGRTYQATVTAVGLTPTVQQGVVSYVVTMGIDTTRIPQGTPVPTPGMTASITIVTNRTENALSIPSRSVRRIGRNQTVTVKTPTGTEQRTVTTGATNGTLIQILSGLEDSDQVLVTAPAAGGTTRPGGAGPQVFGP